VRDDSFPILTDDLEVVRKRPVLDQEQDLVEQLAHVDLNRRHGSGTRVVEEIPDQIIQAARFPEDDLH
jgi:hypothetical protein